MQQLLHLMVWLDTGGCLGTGIDAVAHTLSRVFLLASLQAVIDVAGLFQVGDIVSVIDMPPKELTTWWRGKHGFQVGTSISRQSATEVKAGSSAVWVSSCCACAGLLMDVHSVPVLVWEDLPSPLGLGLEQRCALHRTLPPYRTVQVRDGRGPLSDSWPDVSGNSCRTPSKAADTVTQFIPFLPLSETRSGRTSTIWRKPVKTRPLTWTRHPTNQRFPVCVYCKC